MLWKDSCCQVAPSNIDETSKESQPRVDAIEKNRNKKKCQSPFDREANLFVVVTDTCSQTCVPCFRLAREHLFSMDLRLFGPINDKQTRYQHEKCNNLYIYFGTASVAKWDPRTSWKRVGKANWESTIWTKKASHHCTCEIRRITETSDNGRVKPMCNRCFRLARKTLDEMG